MKQMMKALMSRLMAPAVLQRVGMSLVCVGALLLIVSYMLSRTDANVLLLLYLFMIVVGILLHVRALKGESKY